MWNVVFIFTLSLLLSFVSSKYDKSNKGISKHPTTGLESNRSTKALGRHRGGGIAFRSGEWNPLKGKKEPNMPTDTGDEIEGEEDPCVGACGPYQDCYLDDVTPLCTCKAGYSGHPFTGCIFVTGVRCRSDFECPSDKACKNNLCADPCEGACSPNTECMVINHRASCACNSDTTWNPTFGCVPKAKKSCTSNDQCPADRACVGRQCVDPCVGLCGKNTDCRVTNRHPACACKPGYHGNPFQECKSQSHKIPEESSKPGNLKGEKKFLAINLTKNWVESLAHCRSLNMDLASIENKRQELELEKVLRYESPDKNCWTSGTDLGTIGQFMWATSGTVVDFSALRYFTSTPPTPKKAVTCIEVRNSRGRAQWRSYSCRSKQAFLCEYYEQQ